MIERVSGVLLDAAEAQFVLDALQALPAGCRPSARLADVIGRLRRSVEKLSAAQENTCADVRKLDPQQDSGHIATYDLVDTGEAARILGCTPANVRDLARRGRIPAHRAAERWLYPARSVIVLAERRAARRG